MYSNNLKIKTQFGPDTVSASSQSSILPLRNTRSRSPLRGPRTSNSPGARRMRSASTASSSSLSIVSPATTSTNNSTTSLQPLNQPNTHAYRSASRSPSPIIHADNDSSRARPERVLAMHDYAPYPPNPTCLSFREGQAIHVHNKDPSGWWDGEIDGRRGWFPSNYVHTDTYSPPHRQSESTHVQPLSVASTASRDSTSSLETPQQSQRPSTPDALSQDIELYFPALMVPLLHSLSLLQTAVRANRAAHFPPSTACIITCVRSILSSTETLVRDAPLLQQHPLLAQERRRILSVLSALVAHAKKASESAPDDENHDQEVQDMLRLGGKVFVNVRKFLSIAVQCGIKVPNQGEPVDFASIGGGSWDSQDVSTDSLPYDGLDPSNGMTPTQSRSRDRHPVTAPPALHTKSMGNLRNGSASTFNPKATPLLTAMRPTEPTRSDGRTASQHRQCTLSISSTSSSSSFSSQESLALVPSFPSGPSTAAQVLEALRITHDQYLSTIAAFIGHAHSHSRNSHASSTGHLYNLVREIVEMVCKLLTIVEAVVQSSNVPLNRLGNLKFAKEGLYNVTSSLAESVRLLTLPLPPSTTEEEEKQTLLRSATSALRAGADCVAAVKVCLNRSIGDQPFIIKLPHGDQANQSLSLSKFSESMVSISASTSQALPRNEVDNDLTIQTALLPLRRPREHSSGSSENSAISKSSSLQSEDTAATSPDYTHHKRPSFVDIPPRSTVEADLGSPRSLTRTDEDGTTWEGSVGPEPQDAEERPYDTEFTTASLDFNPELIEDPTVWMLSHDYSIEDVAYNTEGHLVGATLDALVEKMTPHDSIVDAAFSAVFFMTFRLFSSPVELIHTIISRYNIQPPKGISDLDTQLWQQRKGIPVRLRVSNFIKAWVEMYWRTSVDDSALNSLTLFTRNELANFSPAPAQRILELITLRRQTTDFTISPKGDRTRDPGMSINPPSAILLTSEVPRPSMTKTLLVALRKGEFASVAITDFDALELSRQLTIMECNLYCAIQPEEILEPDPTGTKPPINVRAVSSLSTVITGWVAECILAEPDLKKRTNLVRFFIKVADRCTSLHNYSTSRSILAALDSSTISRLHQTWLGIPQKYRLQMDSLRRLADHSRNYHEYRSRLRNTAPPAVPFLGLYLTDVTFCREGNPSHRASPINPSKKLLNFNKYHKLARIVQDMQRFQAPYNLKAIPEAQDYLNFAFEKARHHGGLEDLYRRSLLVEPRQPADTAPTSDMRQLFNWASRSTSQTAAASS